MSTETVGIPSPRRWGTSTLRWLVCGGRDFHDTVRVFACLDHITRVLGLPALLIVGDSRGADASAKMWAQHRGVAGIMCKAAWKKHERKGAKNPAGPIRNARMLTYKPNLVIHFPGGDGTADMVQQATDAGIETIEVPA